MKTKPKEIMILLRVGLDSQCAATTFLSSCNLVLPLLILFCGFLVVERVAREPASNRSSEIPVQTLTNWDTFLCPSAWCSPCSQFCVPRPFISLLLQFRNNLGVSWVAICEVGGLLGVFFERLISPGIYAQCKQGIIFVNI